MMPVSSSLAAADFPALFAICLHIIGLPEVGDEQPITAAARRQHRTTLSQAVNLGTRPAIRRISGLRNQGGSAHMALVLTLRKGEDFFIRNDQITVEEIHSETEFSLRRARDNALFRIREGQSLEL